MPGPFMMGERIYLRALEPEDADLLCRCNNQPEVRGPFFIAFPSNCNLQAEEIHSLYRKQDYVPFAICDGETHEAVGITAFHRVDLVSRAAVFSIRIAEKRHWGKGYGSEATRMMVSYGFEELNLNRIQLHVFTGNQRGLRAYEKAGFVKEGLLREAMYQNDQYHDFHVMGILRREYYEKKSSEKH